MRVASARVDRVQTAWVDPVRRESNRFLTGAVRITGAYHRGMSESPRYRTQMLFAPFGEAGQRRLRNSYATLIGCGALGCGVANTLVRAGIGGLRVVDRDFVEIENLSRQTLFDEDDAAALLPKAEAAARKLRRINSAVEVEAAVADVTAENISELCRDADLILDGTDNIETRFLMNDYCVDARVAAVFGACLGAAGQVLAYIPNARACYRCIWEEPPAPGTLETCDTAGVLMPIVSLVAGWQAQEALKILSGQNHALIRGCLVIDAWSGVVRTALRASVTPRQDCPCCARGERAYLRGARGATSIGLCGRDALQILPSGAGEVDLRRLAERLSAVQRPKLTPYLLRFVVDERVVTVFPDGRAIIQGTTDAAIARSLYAKYVGI